LLVASAQALASLVSVQATALLSLPYMLAIHLHELPGDF
jgi:hypothetical protein